MLLDAKKEHLLIIHPIIGSGKPIKVFGCFTDMQLTLDKAIDEILSRIRPKVTALLRTRAYYSERALIAQFKTHIWGIMEKDNGGIFHASTSLLDRLDNVQDRFLHKLGITTEHAFLTYDLAPPTLRRNISILGMIHKRVLGQCHPSLNHLLPWFSDRFGEPDRHRHTKQLYGHALECKSHWQLFRQSIFAMVDVYNNLPQQVVDHHAVNLFQSHLTHIARAGCSHASPRWRYTFDLRNR